MKKTALLLSICVVILHGCNNAPNGTKENLGAEYGPNHPMDYISYTKDETKESGGVDEAVEEENGQRRVNNYGFSRRDSNEVGLDQELDVYDIIDHQRTAEGIGSLLVQAYEIKDATVLITNQYALVAYTPKEENNEDTAKMVKMTTEAAIPYYYETVVTDHPRMKKDIESFKSMDERDSGNHTALNNLVRDMKETTKQPRTR